MKHNRKGTVLTLAVLSFAAIAMVLRRQLYTSAMDGKGLLLRFTPLEIALLILTVLVFLFLVLMLKNTSGSDRYEDCCRRSIPAALGHIAAAAGVFLTVRTGAAAMVGPLSSVWNDLGLAAAVCLMLAGIARLLGKKPFFLLHAVPCLFFMVHVINHYQLWSSNPQMQDYLFALLGAMALALYSYYAAALEADAGSSRMVVGTGLAAVFLCLTELAWTQAPWLYLGGALWALMGGYSLAPAQKKE